MSPALTPVKQAFLLRPGKVYLVDIFIWDFKEQQRKWLSVIIFISVEKVLSIPWKSCEMYHSMRNFNMIQEIENEGQAIYQLEKGYGCISGPWQWPNIIDQYIIQKEENLPDIDH